MRRRCATIFQLLSNAPRKDIQQKTIRLFPFRNGRVHKVHCKREDNHGEDAHVHRKIQKTDAPADRSDASQKKIVEDYSNGKIQRIEDKPDAGLTAGQEHQSNYKRAHTMTNPESRMPPMDHWIAAVT
jgi:hypothetical protein